MIVRVRADGQSSSSKSLSWRTGEGLVGPGERHVPEARAGVEALTGRKMVRNGERRVLQATARVSDLPLHSGKILREGVES